MLDFELGIAEEVDAVFDICNFEQDVALGVLLSSEDMTGKILLLGISEDFGDQIFVELFLETLESTSHWVYMVERAITFKRGAWFSAILESE